MTNLHNPSSKTSEAVRKITIASFGAANPETLSLNEDKIDLNPGPDEVAISVAYSGINFADIIMRLGFYPDAPKKPFTPGYELSGIVSAVGRNVKHLKPGDEVLSGSFFGGYASAVKLPAWQVIKKPNTLTLEQAAGLPVSFITLHTALHEMARMRQGDDVLIDCATGGLGTFAMQMVRQAGGRGLGLTSTSTKKSLIESFGFDAATHDEFNSGRVFADRKFDIILNSAGGRSINAHFERLAVAGRLVALGISSGVQGDRRRILPMLKSVLTTPRFGMIRLMNASKGVYGLNALRIMHDETKSRQCAEAMAKSVDLIPHIGKVFPADEVVAAHKYIESRSSSGKTLLSWQSRTLH